MSDIIGQPGYMFHNLLPSECRAAAQQLFNTSLGEAPDFKIDLAHPENERFYYVISERAEDGDFVETSRDPSKWAAAIAVAASWGQENREGDRPTRQDIESMGANFEYVALRHFVEKDTEERVHVL